MPDLPIAGPDGQLNPFVSQILLAITTYPDDEEKQRQAVASSVVSVIRQTENPDELMVAAVKQWPWLVESVWRAQPYDDLWARLGRTWGLPGRLVSC